MSHWKFYFHLAKILETFENDRVLQIIFSILFHSRFFSYSLGLLQLLFRHNDFSIIERNVPEFFERREREKFCKMICARDFFKEEMNGVS